MKRIAMLVAIFALFIATALPVAAKSDMYLNYVSAIVDGSTVIGFRGVNGAAATSGQPRVGWVSGYTNTDCWLTWCGSVTFVQDSVTYTAEWI